MDRPIEKKTITPKRIAYCAGGLAILILIIYGFIAASGGSVLKVDSSRVTISEVSRGQFQEFIPVQGTVTPIKTVYLDAVQGGMVEEIYVEEGSLVKAGDSILRLDNTDLHLEIMSREALQYEQMNNLRNTRLAIQQNSLRLQEQLLEIDYRLETAKRTYDQSVILKEKGLISEEEFDRAFEEHDFYRRKKELTIETQRQDSILQAINVEQLEASVERMEKNLAVVRSKQDQLVLKAPIEGQLTSLVAEVGESKSRGQRLGQIDVLEGFKLRAAVDEYYISRISSGQSGEVKLGDQTYELKIMKVYPEVRDGRFEIDLEFQNGEPEGIRRGQTVQVRLALGDLSEAVMLARGGFYSKTGGNWVYLVNESGNEARKHDVRLGRQNPQVYEVLEGLEPGDKVITSSYETLGDFDRLVFKDK
ncbi:MAG: HlyD family efflux transporter periplasmic adaptor subunit [Candidatus Zixiibacteriota bacterium]|nr:MAG: HlyD family efflux transporter periplasmic adaptor subunit [candidate division Zixibacteria bacterium]